MTSHLVKLFNFHSLALKIATRDSTDVAQPGTHNFIHNAVLQQDEGWQRDVRVNSQREHQLLLKPVAPQ